MSLMVHSIDISSLLRARTKFEDFRKHLVTEQEQAGAIKAFEYSFELAWKTMKRILAVRGIIVNSPRETFRQAALEKLIVDSQVWYAFIQARNLTVHTYDQTEADLVIAIFPEFSQELASFIDRLSVPQ